jgi:3'-phosphoadenosine 5'-phosphosulfate sulfotransferase (PAPS reductase)/FAD synthetase
MSRKRINNSAWREMIEEETRNVETFDGTVCVNVSGGHGSAVTWYRCIEFYGRDRVQPVFADTNSEHPDLYRFLDDCEKQFDQKLTRLNDGRNIWDVFDKTGMMRIARAGNACKASIELKQKPLARFYKESGADAIALGLGFLEAERMAAFRRKMEPVRVLFPLAVRPRFSECETHEEIKRIGLRPCTVYADGQPHNNCRKFGCILAGVNQWAADVTANADGFDYSAKREGVFFDKTGFAICRNQTRGTVNPYPLAQLREDVNAGKTFRDDWKSQCVCMEPQQALFSADACFG